MNIKDMVTDGKVAIFTHYKDGELWYVTETGFNFPVPIKDVDGAAVNKVEKASLLMRWIRKHIDVVVAAKINQDGVSP